MTAISIPYNNFQRASNFVVLPWFYAICIGTIITLTAFLILPSLKYQNPTNPEPVIELEFMPWQKLAPVIEKPKPIKKPVAKPKPIAKPKPVVKTEPKPAVIPPPQEIAEPAPIPVPVPEPVEIPVVSETPEPEPEVAETSMEAGATDVSEEVLPTAVPIFQLTNLPRFIRQATPTYPKALKTQGITGKVKLAVLIDANGRVRDIEILKSSHPEFAKAAIEAIQNSSFQAAEVSGRPVATRYKIPFNFRLQ